MLKSLVTIEAILSAVAIAFGVFLHVKTHDWGLAISAALSMDVLCHLFGFSVRYGAVLDGIREACPPDEKPHALALVKRLMSEAEQFRDHSIPLQLLTKRPEEWCLRDRFDQIIRELQEDLEDLEKRRFRVPMNDILEPSLRVCDEIKYSAFCTALDKHLSIFLDMKRGRQLLQANYKAASRLKTEGGFTRLFILQEMASVNPDIYELMCENANNNVRVLVILRHQASEALRHHGFGKRDTDDELDFGLWDDSYKMSITGDENVRWMAVSAAREDLDDARKMKRVLEDAAYSWEEFGEKLRSPLNGPGSSWSSTPEKILHLPPPDGPFQEDVEAIFGIVKRNLSNPGHLGILGLTHLLIEKARSLQAGGENLHVEVADCREYHPRTIERDLIFRSVNWLDWKPKDLCDVIVGDDIFCNLGIWQIPLFCKNVAEALRPSGLFVVRQGAIYSPGLLQPGREEIVARLRKTRMELETMWNDMTDFERRGAVYEIAWPLAHSAEFYDTESRTIDLGKWDDFISGEFAHDIEFANHLLMQRRVRVTSLEYPMLKKWTSKWFDILQEEMTVHSFWLNDRRCKAIPWGREIAGVFQQYYRIVIFTKRPN